MNRVSRRKPRLPLTCAALVAMAVACLGANEASAQNPTRPAGVTEAAWSRWPKKYAYPKGLKLEIGMTKTGNTVDYWYFEGRKAQTGPEGRGKEKPVLMVLVTRDDSCFLVDVHEVTLGELASVDYWGGLDRFKKTTLEASYRRSADTYAYRTSHQFAVDFADGAYANLGLRFNLPTKEQFELLRADQEERPQRPTRQPPVHDGPSDDVTSDGVEGLFSGLKEWVVEEGLSLGETHYATERGRGEYRRDTGFRCVLNLDKAIGNAVKRDKPDVIPAVDWGSYHALVIGNNAYANLNQLQTAVSDARAVAELLANEYGFKVTLLENATRRDTIVALEKLRRTLDEKANLLIYYAGHGDEDKEIRRGYWLPVDAEASNSANWISHTWVRDQLKGAKAKHVLVVSDSCFAGALMRGPTIRPNGTRDDDYFARLASNKARLIMTSGGNEPVQDGGGGKHSVFAKYFLDVLRGNKSVIESQRLFQSIRRLVILNARQTPGRSAIGDAGHEDGDFLFVRRQKPDSDQKR